MACVQEEHCGRFHIVKHKFLGFQLHAMPAPDAPMTESHTSSGNTRAWAWHLRETDSGADRLIDLGVLTCHENDLFCGKTLHRFEDSFIDRNEFHTQLADKMLFSAKSLYYYNCSVFLVGMLLQSL